ncbi:MAG: pirin family protein [Deltaproteobacteria bacterium]|nr:pirin family protein [Deltaproteobacteria bacterium]MBW2537273.1 pirin family protein [Deltaproteobacteria bacterium]
MSTSRKVRRVSPSTPTMEGAGVSLRRVFGFRDPTELDPFLLMDDFRNDRPDQYEAGFPWHPHRGIETITYVLEGEVAHGDSLGNEGTIGPGDVQWMTAGSGIVHQEMPQGDARGRMGGFQLWANLPRTQKMMAPRYRDVRAAEIPEVELPGGAGAKVIAGELGGARGPVRDVVIDPTYADLSLPPGSETRFPTPRAHTAFAYVIEGAASFGGSEPTTVADRHLVVLDEGDEVVIAAGAAPARLLFVAGKPLGEPVAWRGPIVMNTEEELRTAFEEYRRGTFIKHGKAP